MNDTTGTTADSPGPVARGVSPYATGGGGVTLERRAAAVQLAGLLTGITAVELHGRRVERVAFQQAPAHRVDDLLVTAARDDGTGTLELTIAVRRAPSFTTSDSDTEKLVGELLAELAQSQPGAEKRLAICVAGPQPAAQQVGQLAALAARQATAPGFFALVRTPRRFQQAVLDRLGHLVNLVAANMVVAGPDTSASLAETATWELLRRLDVLMPRLEAPDETDWNDLLNQLEPWAREPTVAAAAALRDRLEALAAGYAPAAADVDLAALRRDTHEVLHIERRRRAVAWTELRRLDADARGAVRGTVGVDATGAGLHLARQGQAGAVLRELRPGPPVLVSGESGVGKSALVLGELTAAAGRNPVSHEVVCLNLRLLPRTIAKLRDAIGAPPEHLLREMSAPNRALVLDAADVIIERDDQLLAPLVRAALDAGVTPWVVCATDGRAAVHAVLENMAGAVREVTIGGLDDAELDKVVLAFPHLRRLVDEPHAKELLRRPAVVDLFVRSGSDGLPLSDADALDIVWAKLVRNDERTTRGLPDARDQVIHRLAAHQLRPGGDAATHTSLDPAAVGGLHRDGLLRPADRWRTLPAFAHDLLRTFAVARVLLATGDPVAELIACDAPRWALPAARLVVQVLLTAPDTAHSALPGRVARVQAAVDRLTEAGYGDRWGDLPTEALLTLPGAGDLLDDAWPTLVESDASGLRRLLRVAQQRHARRGVIDRLVAEPVVALLLDRGWPSALHEQVHELLCGWLHGLILSGEPAGHPLRAALRQRLAARVATGDERLAQSRREREARLAARTPEEVAADEKRAREMRSITVFSSGAGRRRRWCELPGELTADDPLEELALLGADLGEEGEALLRRLAADAPQHLAPAVEEPLTGHSLASYDTSLLIDLVEAFYIDQRDEDDDFGGYDGMGDDGIRHHERGPVTPLAAFYRGPFLALFRADLRGGVACLNRLLNHAARARVQILRRRSWGEPPEPEDRYITELDTTGERRRYVGDGQVWFWYRGTGVGPYPCMSALQALELVCDEYLNAGASPGSLVRVLLDGCENLAMPALVVGMLVRHLERITKELDSFLAEPAIWHLEFGRATQEYSGLVARTEGITAPERRRWNLRDVCAQLAFTASHERAEALRAVGRRLVARATEVEAPADGEPLSEELAVVHGWAGSLDRDSYRFTSTDEGVLFEQVPDPVVVARLAESNADLARGREATRILMRYPERFDRHADHREVTRDELLADLAIARDLAENPPAAGPLGAYDAPAAVAAAALEARFTAGIDVPDEDLVWAARSLVELVIALADQGASDDDYAVFGSGPDHSAARGLPLLALPAARALRDQLSAEGVTAATITRAESWIVERASNEARLFLIRAFDPLWRTPCDTTGGRCHHATALAVVEDTARACLIGPWDPAQHRNARVHIDGPVAPQLTAAEHDRIYVPQLAPTIRGAAAAAASDACCRADAAALLTAALAAHRRGMRSSKHGYHHSANDAAAAARAVLDVAGAGDSSLLFAHLDGYADHARLLHEFLHALAAAGEESPARAAAAREAWPVVLDRVVEFVASGLCPRDERYCGEDCLAAAIPIPSYDAGYLHREYTAEPILWADAVSLAPHIERWLPLAAGHRDGVDALAHLLHRLPTAEQASVGLPWMEQLVMADPDAIASRSYLLPEWLEQVRPHATSPALRAVWHRIVDALTVAGDDRIAAMAD